MKPKLRKIPLKPYLGVLYVAETAKQFESAHKRLFGESFKVDKASDGGWWMDGHTPKGEYAHLIWACSRDYLVHELLHVALKTFNLVEIDPRQSDESFCYFVYNLLESLPNYPPEETKTTP
jgi:hypothetical protein